MWQRFTERARRVVFHAQAEAQARGAEHVCTEHLLLGICHEPGSVADKIFGVLGFTIDAVFDAALNEFPEQAPVSIPDPKKMLLTSEAKRTIDAAYFEAKELRNNYIGTEHLLLGMARNTEGTAGRVLAKMGVSAEKIRAAISQLNA